MSNTVLLQSSPATQRVMRAALQSFFRDQRQLDALRKIKQIFSQSVELGIAGDDMWHAHDRGVFVLRLDGLPTSVRLNMRHSAFATLSGDIDDVVVMLGRLDDVDLLPQAERFEREFARQTLAA